MRNRTKHNLQGWALYSVMSYIILIPCQIWIPAISISLLAGFLFGSIDAVITELRKLNGEKFPNLEEEKERKN